MKPLFFGSSRRRLYGVYHAAHAATARDEAVLLCHPGVQEYNATHWAFRKLAAMLVRDGFHVLRFDWSGTGDSAGDVQDVSPADWIDDVGVAARELAAVSAARSLSIVGMRLGAALGALACAAGLSVGELVLWEPVVVGRRYVDELERLDASENFRLLHRGRRGKEQLVGYAFPSAMREAVAEIDLRKERFEHAKRLSMFVSSDRAEHRELREVLSSAGVAVGCRQVLEDATGAGALESALLSNNVLVAITDHLSGRVS